jgi:hypothetical protein
MQKFLRNAKTAISYVMTVIAYILLWFSFTGIFTAHKTFIDIDTTQGFTAAFILLILFYILLYASLCYLINSKFNHITFDQGNDLLHVITFFIILNQIMNIYLQQKFDPIEQHVRSSAMNVFFILCCNISLLRSANERKSEDDKERKLETDNKPVQ